MGKPTKGSAKNPSPSTSVPITRDLDDLDRALIARLRVDGREGNRSLGTALQVNEVTVSARLRRLEDAGLMRVVAVTDIRLFGHREFAFAMINVGGRSAYEVAADVAALPEAMGVSVCTGRFDIVVTVLGRDRLHIADLFSTILPKVKGVRAIRGSTVLDVTKYESEWSLLDIDPGTTPSAQPSDTVDELDLAIIASLQHNARRSNRQIAADLAVSEGTVRSRIKRMLNDRLFRIQAISDIAAAGLTAHTYVAIRTAPGRTTAVSKALSRRADVIAVLRVLDGYDLIAFAYGTDRQSLTSAVLEEIALLPGIQSVEMFDTVRHIKHTYLWTWIV